MTFRQNIVYLVVRKDTEIALRPHYLELEQPDADHQFAGHYNLFLILSREARDRPMFSFFLRPLAAKHRDDAIHTSKVFPGALGSKALERLGDGDIDGAVEDLREVIIRQEVWNTAHFANEEDHLLLFRYLSLCGDALGKIGHFSEGRYYLAQSLEKYEQLPPSTQVDEAEMAQDTVKSITWYLLLEMKYGAALDVVTKALSNFAFSSYRTETIKSLEEIRAILETVVPALSEFQADAATDTLFINLLGKIERCATAEGARKLRKEIVFELKQRSSDLGLRQSRDATIASIRRSLELLPEISTDECRMQVAPNLLTEEQIRDRFDDEEQRQGLRDLQDYARSSQESLRQFILLNDELARTMETFAKDLAEQEIAFISGFPDKPFEIPANERRTWFLLELKRFGTQILLIAYVLEELIRKLIEDRGTSALAKFEFKHKELWIKLGVFIFIFVAGKILEKITDKRQLMQYKMALTSLVMDRARVLWLSYNILESAAKRAKENLKRTEDDLKKALEKKAKKLENPRHFNFGELGEFDLPEFNPEKFGLPSDPA